MKDIQTFIYPRPAAIAELRPRGGNSIVIPDVAPEEVWIAIDRLLPIWKQARLFFLPRLNFPRCEC